MSLRLEPGAATPHEQPTSYNFGASWHVVNRDAIVPVGDLVFLEEALQELLRRCMDDRGFRYAPAEVQPHMLAGPLDKLGLLTLQSREQAERWGYGGPSAFRNDDAPGGQPSFPTPNADYLRGLSEADAAAWDEALSGPGLDITAAESQLLEAGELAIEWVDNEGCIGISEAAIYGDLRRFMQLNSAVRSSIRGEVRSRIEAAPAFVAAVAEWAACMQRQGYGFAEPHEAVSAVSKAYVFESLDTAQALEAEIAPVDGRCSESSGLFDAVDAEMLRAAEEVVAEREGEILAYRELIATAVANAKELLDAP